MKTVKQMLLKSPDPWMALLSYRTTPLPWCGLSPAELCMGRKLRTPIPQSDKLLILEWSFLEMFRSKNKDFKERQQCNFNRRHRVRELAQIPEESEVWITTEDPPIQGRVIGPARPPRSYIVETPTGQIHRNREHLNVIPEPVLGQEHQTDSNETPVVEPPPQAQPTPKIIMTRSRTGTIIRPPDRLS